MNRFLKDTVRKAYWHSTDALNFVLRRPDTLMPPKKLVFVGEGDFAKIGGEFLNYFVQLGQLEPHHRVLDIGCGIGRMAIPLTSYLTSAGSYEGFDIVGYGIDWCRKKITPKFPNFRFQVADVYNEAYNPQGRQHASTYKFPFADESFDFVFATSVFTHMFIADTENYLSEIARVLKQDGKSLLTLHLLNAEAQQHIDAQRSIFSFAFQHGGCRVEYENNPGFAVAYQEKVVRDFHQQHGMRIVEPIRYGSWCGRDNGLSHQDLVLASKAGGFQQ